MQKIVFLVGLTILLSCNKAIEESKSITTDISIKTEYSSSEPNLHKADNGTIYLTWTETINKNKSRLLFSVLENDQKWSTPITIIEGNDWFVNWADFPALISFGKNNLAVHYLKKSAADIYAYNVKIAISNDLGSSWNTNLTPHNDHTNSEHGFVSKVPLTENTFLSI